MSKPSLAKFIFFGLFVVLGFSCISTDLQKSLAMDYYNLGNAFFEQEDFQRAGEMYQRARELDPDLVQVGFNWARVMIQSGDFQQAEELLEELLSRDPNNLLVQRTLAFVNYYTEDIAAAISGYESILETNPGDLQALYNLGFILFGEEQWEASASYWEEYRTLNGKEEVTGELAAIYQEIGEIEKARDLYLEMDQNGSAGFVEYLELGRYYSDGGEWGLAAEYLEKAIPVSQGLEEELAQLNFDLGVIYIREIVDWENAQKYFKDALEKGFRDSEETALLFEDQELLFRSELLLMFRDYGWSQDEGVFELSEEGIDSDQES